MTLIIAAHGTRDPAGAQAIHALAARVRARLSGVDVQVAFADVRSPSVTEVLAGLDEPAVVVPAFLAAGYHVRVDIPAQVARSGHASVTVTDSFGPAPALVAAVHERLVEAGWVDEPIVLAAAGSSDARALSDVQHAAVLLRARTEVPVVAGYITTAQPRVADLVRGHGFAVASWLLAPGLFHRVARRTGAGIVSEPIGAHPNAVDLVIRRYHKATAELSRSRHRQCGPVPGYSPPA